MITPQLHGIFDNATRKLKKQIKKSGYKPYLHDGRRAWKNPGFFIEKLEKCPCCVSSKTHGKRRRLLSFHLEEGIEGIVVTEEGVYYSSAHLFFRKNDVLVLAAAC